jgi:hypothetical protein
VVVIDKIEVINYVPKFLTFFEKANLKQLDSNERWLLWEEHYNFAAVPPTKEGRELARSLLDQAWGQYEGALSFIESWEPDQQAIRNLLQKVKLALGCKENMDFAVLYFVGAFDGNPFVAPYGENRLVLCLPVEEGNTDITLAHELTHIVHSKTADLSASWERTIGSTILQEGLATRVSQYVVPSSPDKDYVEHTPGWLQSAELKSAEIIDGVIPYLDDSSSDTVTMFTFGNGTADIEREAYYIGWVLVGRLLSEGVTYEEMAHIPEGDIPEYVRVNLTRHFFNRNLIK